MMRDSERAALRPDIGSDAANSKAPADAASHNPASGLGRGFQHSGSRPIRPSGPVYENAVFLPQGGADGVGAYDQLLFSVLRRPLRTLDRVSIGRDFLSFQPQPRLCLNSRNERVLRQSIERLNRVRKRHWSPIQVEIETSLQSGPIDHRRA